MAEPHSPTTTLIVGIAAGAMFGVLVAGVSWVLSPTAFSGGRDYGFAVVGAGFAMLPAFWSPRLSRFSAPTRLVTALASATLCGLLILVCALAVLGPGALEGGIGPGD